VRVRWEMVVGGLLWLVHGYLRFLTPHGTDVVWREGLGYSQVVRVDLFVLYNLTGVAALLLTSGGTLRALSSLRTVRRGLVRAARIVALLAVLFSLGAAAGLVLLFDPLTTAGLDLGEPLLGVSLFLTGLAVVTDRDESGHPRWLGPLLIGMGALGLATLPLRPAIYAIGLVPLGAGTVAFALFGAGWIVLGIGLRAIGTTAAHPTPPSA